MSGRPGRGRARGRARGQAQDAAPPRQPGGGQQQHNGGNGYHADGPRVSVIDFRCILVIAKKALPGIKSVLWCTFN